MVNLAEARSISSTSSAGSDREASVNAYDEVAYPGYAYPQTHPTRVAAVAELLGLNPKDPTQCRVLELACGDGINVIAMGTALCGSHFVGVDLAARAIAAGQELIAEVGLHNVTLQVADASQLPADLGRFDYVIAHGVYSWVDDTVRDGLLRSIKAHLAPEGIAYVSFSCFPGAYFRQLAREVMSFHSGDVSDPAARLARGIEFLRFAREAHGGTSAYAVALDQEIHRVTKADPGYVLHDDFSEHNTPVYFAEFAAHLAQHGLAYLSEAGFDGFFDSRLPSAVRERVTQFAGGDRIAEQQYLDFVRGTPFRRVLVCHEARAAQATLDSSRLLPLFVRAGLQPTTPEPDPLNRDKVTFRTRGGIEMETDEPLAKALLLALSQAWPEPRKVSDVFQAAKARVIQTLSGTATDDAYPMRVLIRTLLSGAASQAISLWSGDLLFAARCGDRPKSSPLARAQAKRSELVTSLRGITVRLADEPARELLAIADGSQSREQLLAALRARFVGTKGFAPGSFTPETLDTTLQGLAERAFMLE